MKASNKKTGGARKTVLGRGLEALIPASEEGRIHMLSVSQIAPSRHQARKKFNKDTIMALSETITERGVLQPLLVSPDGTGWRLIAGERRLRAAEAAGLKKVPVIIKDGKESDMAIMSLIENLQREDLNPMEEARGISSMMKEFTLTQDQIAHKIGKSRSAVANTLRLIHFPPDIVAALDEEFITEGHARALVNITDPKKRKYIISRIKTAGLSVRETENLAGAGSYKKPRKRLVQASAELKEIQETLESALATKVEIRQSKNNKGVINIHFFSNKEFDRIIKKISR